MLVPPSFLFALDLSCGVTSCHSCGVMSATAQLCSRANFLIPALSKFLLYSSIDPLSATAQLCSTTISPKVVRDFLIPALSKSL